MVTLSDAHLAQLNALVSEMPHKFAFPIIHFVNSIVAAQQLEATRDAGKEQKKDPSRRHRGAK